MWDCGLCRLLLWLDFWFEGYQKKREVEMEDEESDDEYGGSKQAIYLDLGTMG